MASTFRAALSSESGRGCYTAGKWRVSGGYQPCTGELHICTRGPSKWLTVAPATPPPSRCRRLTLKPEPKVSPRFSVVNLKPPIIPAGQDRIFAELYQLTDRFANWLRGDGVEDSLQVSSCCLRALCGSRTWRGPERHKALPCCGLRQLDDRGITTCSEVSTSSGCGAPGG